MSTTVKDNRKPKKSGNGGQPAAETGPRATKMPQSAAAPSPFTPIAEYGFISDCHTGALVAPDGSIDWLCVPRFDSASVFGSLLDRGAGVFRLGPFGINVPAGRTYEPGTNTLMTVWKIPSGWAVVRDALTIGPRRGEDTITPHTRPPTDEDADHMLIRTVECIDSCTAPCPGPRAWRRLRRSLRPTRSLMRRNGSGATGCRGRGSPITRCRSATAPASAVAS